MTDRYVFRCDKEYFMDEVGLKAVPKGDWFCGPCVAAADKKGPAVKKTAAKKR